MHRILITDNLSTAGLDVLRKTEGIEPYVRSGLSQRELNDALQGVDGIIVDAELAV